MECKLLYNLTNMDDRGSHIYKTRVCVVENIWRWMYIPKCPSRPVASPTSFDRSQEQRMINGRCSQVHRVAVSRREI